MSIEIINLKYYQGKDYQHIGRGSIFGNPFEIGRDGSREEVIEKYRDWFNHLLKDDRFKKEILKLRGQKLGCWCKEPDKEIACHGDIIKEYLEKYCNNIPEKFKLGVIGSRGWRDQERIFRILDKNIDKIEMIVSGGCINSPDEIADKWCRKTGVPILTFYSKWHDENGVLDRGAGFKRNRFIAETSDKLVAFQINKSKGTQNTIDTMLRLGKPVKIFENDI